MPSVCGFWLIRLPGLSPGISSPSLLGVVLHSEEQVCFVCHAHNRDGVSISGPRCQHSWGVDIVGCCHGCFSL